MSAAKIAPVVALQKFRDSRKTAARRRLRNRPAHPSNPFFADPDRSVKMVKPSGSKLLNLLQKERGYDHKKDKQKRLRKQAEKRKQQKTQEDDSASEEDHADGGVAVNGSAHEDSSSGADEAEKQIRAEARKASAEKHTSEDEEDSDDEETSKVPFASVPFFLAHC